MIAEVFTLWTPWAVLAAAAGGAVMAQVVIHLRPQADTRLTSYLMFVLGVIWYLPLVTQRAFDQQAPEYAELRTIGTLLLYELCFAPAAAVALAIHRRRHP